MSVRNRDMHVWSVGRGRKQIFRSLKAGIAQSAITNEADCSALFTRISLMNNLWRDDLYQQLKKVSNSQLEDEPQSESVDDGGSVLENESAYDSDYDLPIYKYLRSMI